MEQFGIVGFLLLFCFSMQMQMQMVVGDVVVTGIGMNWGSQSSHRLPAATVVKLLQKNRIKRIRILDTEPTAMKALSSSNIKVFVGIANEMLKGLSSSKKIARSWVHDNISRYVSKGGIDIRYIAVGNDPFLKSNSGHFQPFVLPAALNIQAALEEAELASKMKVVIPCSTDIYQNISRLPSKAMIRPDLNKTMHQLLSFLKKNESPFVINFNPFEDFHQKKNFSAGFVFFENGSHPVVDGKNVYYNDFDWNLDTLESVLKKLGFGQMPVIVGEIGWPTDGAPNATSANAQRFYAGLIDRIKNNNGTPLRPGNPPVEVYFKSLLDEDQMSVAHGKFQRHWGIFTFDGQAKYPINIGQGSQNVLVNAQNVLYLSPRWCVANDNKDLSNASSHVQEACSTADCTALSNGGSCNHLGSPGNISYAFNSYYQLYNQSLESCDFDGLGMITTVDPSVGDCRFLVAINDSFASSLYKGIQKHLVAHFILIAFSLLFL